MMLNKRKGFTLLEMMISIGIMITLAAISIVGYRRYQWSIDFRGSLNALTTDIKLAQQEAMTNKYPDKGPLTTSFCLVASPDGKTYAIAAYHTCSINPTTPPPVALIKTVNLPGAVKLTGAGTLLTFDQRGMPIDLPITPVQRENPSAVASPVVITLEQPNLNVSKKIVVNLNGSVIQEKY